MKNKYKKQIEKAFDQHPMLANATTSRIDVRGLRFRDAPLQGVRVKVATNQPGSDYEVIVRGESDEEVVSKVFKLLGWE